MRLLTDNDQKRERVPDSGNPGENGKKESVMDILSEGVNPWRNVAALNPAAVQSAEAERPTAAGNAASRVTSATETTETNPASEEETEDDGFSLFGEDGFSFFDILDMINPLQHIPLISTMYREVTGDDLSPASRVVGGTLFFGPAGGGTAVANVLLEAETGKDVGEHVLALFEDEPRTLLADGGAPLTAEPSASSPPPKNEATPAVLSETAHTGTDSANPVLDWARAQQAYYQAGAAGAAPTQTAAAAPLQTAANTVGTPKTAEDPVMDWARAQLAWLDNAAAQEASVAAAKPRTPPIDERALPQRDTVARQPDSTQHAEAAPPTGAAAANGGWFSDVLVSDWAREQASLTLADPTYRPDIHRVN